MKIYALMENMPYDDAFAGEHGLSLYIETESRSILFDSGQSERFAENAEKLGIDLGKVDIMIISHGHYDHGGGLRRFLELNESSPVYLSRYAFEPHFSGRSKYIGIDPSLASCERLVYVDDRLETGGLELLSCNGEERKYESGGAGLYALEDGKFVPDSFRHELYLKFTDRGRNVVISGCSHKGVLNISRWLRPDVLIGGFHFKNLDMTNETDVTKLDNAAEGLMSSETVYYTCHCTGEAQYRRLKERMGDRLNYISSGQVIEI